MNHPCKQCISFAICISREVIVCSLLFEYLYKSYDFGATYVMFPKLRHTWIDKEHSRGAERIL